MGLFNYNYILIAKNTTKYYLELKRNYADRFKDDVSLLATAGVLDARAYVFMEETISIKELLRFAKTSRKEPFYRGTRKNVSLINFIAELEIEILSIDTNAGYSIVRDIVRHKYKVIEKTVLKTQKKYRYEPRISEDTNWFMTDPNNRPYWDELGIKKTGCDLEQKEKIMSENVKLRYSKHIQRIRHKTLTFDEVGKAVSATLNVITEADLKRAENGDITAKVFIANLGANYEIFRAFLQCVAIAVHFDKEKAIDEYMGLLSSVAFEKMEERIERFLKED